MFVIPNEILNLIFSYVERNKVGTLFINPIMTWKTYLRHFYAGGDGDGLVFYKYYFSRYKTVYSKKTVTAMLPTIRAIPLRK